MQGVCGINMTEIKTFYKKEYPAKLQTFGLSDERPQSGFFNLHFTYPDTEYNDPTDTQWGGGAGSNQLGMNYLIRTRLANGARTYSNGEDDATDINYTVIDLKRAYEASVAAGSTKTYDLGTEEASRLIAATINSSRNRQASHHLGRERFLRAKYQNMGPKKSYTFSNSSNYYPFTGLFTTANGPFLKTTTKVFSVGSSVGSLIKNNEKIYTISGDYIGKLLEVNNTLDIVMYEQNASDLPLGSVIVGGWFYTNDWNVDVLPSDLPQKGIITQSTGGAYFTLTYDGWEHYSFSNTPSMSNQIRFNITKVEHSSGSVSSDIIGVSAWSITNEPQHTVIVSWEYDTPAGGGYWGTANGGPIVQGLGTSLPVWYLTAKPMDGGNLGLPSLAYDSKGAQPVAHTLGHGYSRFSIEGLNSCVMPELPPPDMPFNGPAIMGEVEADPFQWDGLSANNDDDLLITKPEYNTKMDEMGPYESGCVVTLNDLALLSGLSDIKVLAPNTNLHSHYKVGDSIYNSEGSNIATNPQITSISDIHSTGLIMLGPICTNTEITINGNFTTAVSTITTNQDPSALPIGTNIMNTDGVILGRIGGVTTTTITFLANLNYNVYDGEIIFLDAITWAVSPTGIDYTADHFKDNIPLMLYTGGTEETDDKEAFGGHGGLSDYSDTTVGNPALLLDNEGNKYATITTPLIGSSVIYAPNTFSSMRLGSLIKTIPTQTESFRQCATITISGSINPTSIFHNDMLFKGSMNKWQIALENGYKLDTRFSALKDDIAGNHHLITNVSNGSASDNKAISWNSLKSEATTITSPSNYNQGVQGYVSRPYRTVRTVNTERVKGLSISNEERVWDNISVIDDKGQELVLEGGSPFGTVIKDYTLNKERIDPLTGTTTTLPSTPGSGIEPNMEISLPSQDEIPGNIIVRSGHDRVQAWRNLSWGMGGLSDPRPDAPGIIEANADTYDTTEGGATQFDTNDRVLHFHPVRILHDTMVSQFGLNTNAAAGAVPSGSTRLFAAHRLSDHTERGSVLLATQNGVDHTQTHPHHRIRFGRQGHHFITPYTMRGTPIALRRQLHRSHGSAYSLMFEAESENKHWGFQSAYSGVANPPSATLYYLDTLEVNGETYNAGSYSADGFPLGEIGNNGMPNHRKKYGADPQTSFDLLFAPGQEHTLVEGAYEQAHFISGTHGKSTGLGPYPNTAHSGPIAINTASNRIVVNRHNASEEYAINGFFLNQYLMMGGRPSPSWINAHHVASGTKPHFYSNTGLPAGWHRPRVATELGTVPPLFGHDPEMLNMSAVPVATVESPTISGDFTQTTAHNDLGLIKATDTNSGATPDAFLCTWLAEYSHPALFGTSREHFMTMRYREAGMPKSVQYPAVRGLLLRNASEGNSSDGVARIATPIERLYAFQWMQNYGYNALNAGGHGANWGERAASAVLMGHSGQREPRGSLELRQHFTLYGASNRYSRGEGIGDGLNPRKTVSRLIMDKDATNGYIWNETTTVENAMVAIDWSRRLPVRAWGFRTGCDALNMLSGDPTEILTTQQKIQRSARFDGGKHDSMQNLPTVSDGADWTWPTAYSGVERTVPIGVVITGHTNEGYDNEGFTRLSNEPWVKGELKVGMGRTLNHADLGMIKPTSLTAGVMDSHRTEFATITGSNAKFLQAKSTNTGSDPIIGLNHHSGDKVKAADSVEAIYQSDAFGASVGNEFYHHKGNNLHINAHPVDIKVNSGDQKHFPAHGWGQSLNMKDKTEAERGVMPIPLSEITDHRQIQSDLTPRLGLVVETNSERNNAKQTDYMITSTKAVSLHSDLAIGQQFPILPSWVQDTKWTKYAESFGAGSISPTNPDNTYGGQNNPNQQVAKPQWSLNRNSELNLDGNALGDSSQHFLATGVKDHWAVRGCGDLPPWGGVFILRKTWLEREEKSKGRRSIVGDGATSKPQISQPVRRTADYIMRMTRPLKVYGFSTLLDVDLSILNQDGWLLGPYCSLSQAGSLDQAFTRDKRYGMFETNTAKTKGNILPITSAYDEAPTIEWPDANNRDAVWHLIPSANMLQHFKADASRKDTEGHITPLVDARYSQTTHPGGGEVISQTETVYATDGTTVVNPYNRREREGIAVKAQPATAMTTLGPKTKVTYMTGSTITVENATPYPPSGTLVILGKTGQITYTARTENTFTVSSFTGDLISSANVIGGEVCFGKNSASTNAAIQHLYPPTHSLVVLPSFVDNAASFALSLTDKWDATSSDDITTYSPNISYRGLGHYDPSDFFMLTPQQYLLSDGFNSGIIKYKKTPGTGGLSTIYADGAELTTTAYPPYLLDSDKKQWRIAGNNLNTGQGKNIDYELQFRNLNNDSLSASGMGLGKGVRLGHIMAVGVRTTDAALMIMNDGGDNLAGIDIVGFSASQEQKMTDLGVYDDYSAINMSKQAALSAFISAHPSLDSTVQHSSIFVARKSQGVGVLDMMRDLSRIDGYQLLLTDAGLLLYSPNVFIGRDRRIGSNSGAQSISVSAMLEMANEVIVEGDKVAENEIIRGKVKDLEKVKQMGGKGNDEGVTRILQERVVGLRENNLALRLAKGFLNRSEQGASLIKVEGLMKATDIQPGEILMVDFIIEHIKGEFAVFEVFRDYTTGLTDIIIGQYEKGIEGLLADLQTASNGVIDANPSRTKERTDLVFNAPIKIVASARIMTRFVNNTKTIIGGYWRGSPTTAPLGNIGVSGGRSGVLANGAILAGASTNIVVDGIDATLRFGVHDGVYTSANLLIGYVAVVNTNLIVLKANNLVIVPDNDELRVASIRAKPLGQSKSVFYEVR